MLDIHTHILPGVDDGCNTMAEALELKILVETRKPGRNFESSDQNRPGLQFTGFFEIFRIFLR